jgi:thiaminase
VRDLLVFQSHLALRAPDDARAVVEGGVAALEAELTWFEETATAQRIELNVVRAAASEQYRRLLDSLDAAPFTAASVGLWAIERAYHDAWADAAPGAPAYRAFVEHWTVPEFATYVADLARTADAALSAADPDAQAEAVAAFLEVAQLEADFWQMTWSGEGDEGTASQSTP